MWGSLFGEYNLFFFENTIFYTFICAVLELSFRQGVILI